MDITSSVLKGNKRMKSILVFLEENYEDLELWYPKIRLEEAGHKVVIAAPISGHIYIGKHGYPCKSERALDQIEGKEFDGLVIPGGFSPDKLRRIPKVLKLTHELDQAGKLIAFICHGGWVPISAKILKNRKATSTIAIKDDMENAGTIWSDQALVIDRNLISSRTPSDLPLFGKALVDYFHFEK
jgi:protease I